LGPFYEQYRGRGLGYVREFMRRHDLRRRIEFADDVVEA
jgi:hypothetical protein